MTNFEYEQYKKEIKELRELGFEFCISSDSYSVRFKGKFVDGGTVKLPRGKPRHWRHREADLRDNVRSAAATARTAKRRLLNDTET